MILSLSLKRSRLQVTSLLHLLLLPPPFCRLTLPSLFPLSALRRHLPPPVKKKTPGLRQAGSVYGITFSNTSARSPSYWTHVGVFSEEKRCPEPTKNEKIHLNQQLFYPQVEDYEKGEV